ncbi:MAG: CPBP family intramembrane metalloprotease [Propionicimonas sp.]|uniref:CPBP family intramembrane glutamic endopeptidase n=1 Tax=Propionicimonas sp. TaxID=1955623 RepID=UPI003D151F78
MVPEPGLNDPHGTPVPPQPAGAPGAGYPGWPAPAAPFPQQPFPQQQVPYPAGPQGPVPYPYGYAPGPWQAGPPPKPSALPTVPREYHEFYRTPRFRWWKPLAALALFAASALIATTLFSMLILIDVANGRIDLNDMASGNITTTPMLFLANNLGIAVWVPLALLSGWAVFGQRPKWLSSIAGGFRWRLFGRFALIAFLVLGISTGIQVALSGGVGDLAWNPDSLFLILTILLTTPFQCAGEEYSLRGLGARCIGSWFSWRRAGLAVATAVTSVVFMLLHGAGDPWLNAFYLLFAVTSSVLVWRTGGLEASIALHVCNNMISEAFMPFTDISGLFNREAGTAGPETLWQMAAVLLVAGLMLWQARKLKLQRKAAPAAPAAMAAPATPR